MKTLIAVLIVLNTIAYGQVDSVAFYNLDMPKGLRDYIINPNIGSNKFLIIDKMSPGFCYSVEQDKISNNTEIVTEIFNEFKRIIDANGITEDNLISYVPIYYMANGKFYPFTVDGLLLGFKKEFKNTGKFGFTFQVGAWKYIISIYPNEININIHAIDEHIAKEYLKVFPDFISK